MPVLVLLYWAIALYALAMGAGNWAAVLFPLLLVLPVWLHRARVAAVMRTELSREAFARQPRAFPHSFHHGRIADAIDREQYAALTIYDPSRPFIGMGVPYEPWSFALELKRRGAAPDGGAGPLTGRMVVDLIRPRVYKRQGPAEGPGGRGVRLSARRPAAVHGVVRGPHRPPAPGRVGGRGR